MDVKLIARTDRNFTGMTEFVSVQVPDDAVKTLEPEDCCKATRAAGARVGCLCSGLTVSVFRTNKLMCFYCGPIT